MFEKFIISLVKRKKRKGRGISSGMGKTCGRGTKGQKARKSGHVRPGFEGGQTSIYRRLPKGGIYNSNHKKEIFKIVSLDNLQKNDKLLNGQTIDFSLEKTRVKVLGTGNLIKSLTVKAHSFSLSAKEKIEKAGGTAVYC